MEADQTQEPPPGAERPGTSAGGADVLRWLDQQQITRPTLAKRVPRPVFDSARRVGDGHRPSGDPVEHDEVPEALAGANMGDGGQRGRGQAIVVRSNALGGEAELLGGADHPQEIGSDAIGAGEIPQLLYRDRPTIVERYGRQCRSAAVTLIILSNEGVASEHRTSPAHSAHEAHLVAGDGLSWGRK